MKILLVPLLLLLSSCLSEKMERMTVSVEELKAAAVPALENIAATAKNTARITAMFAPAPVEPSGNNNGEEIEAIQGQLRNRGIWATLLTLLIGYRFVGGRKVNVGGVGKGIWGALKGAFRGVAGAMGKAMPNGEKKA